MNQQEARQIAKTALGNTCAPRTVAQYERQAARLLPDIEQADGGVASALETLVKLAHERSWSDATFGVYKAALQYVLGKRLMQAVRDVDRARKAEDREAAREARREMNAVGAGLIGLNPDPDHQHRNDPRVVRAYKSSRKRRARSKRRSVQELQQRGLAPLLSELPATDRPGVLVLAVTGARPSELRKGIELEVAGTQLIATITGAKISEHSGQSWRRLFLDTTDPAVGLAAKVVRELADEKGVFTVRHECDERWRSAFRRAAKRAGMPHVTPYSLRHWFASEAKSSGVDRATLAAAMGHLVDRTQQNYGQSRYGAGGSAMRSVEADRPVKHRPGWLEYQPAPDPSPGFRPG